MAACRRLDLDPQGLSLAGGEDYELLFSLRAGASKRLSLETLSRRLGVKVTRIGSVTAGSGVDGLPALAGFRHYA